MRCASRFECLFGVAAERDGDGQRGWADECRALVALGDGHRHGHHRGRERRDDVAGDSGTAHPHHDHMGNRCLAGGVGQVRGTHAFDCVERSFELGRKRLHGGRHPDGVDAAHGSNVGSRPPLAMRASSAAAAAGSASVAASISSTGTPSSMA